MQKIKKVSPNAQYGEIPSQLCNPRKNTTILRHKFFTYRQEEGQKFGDFVTHLKTLSQDCDFLTLRDSLVKDMIICGVTDNKLRERFLREADLDLDEAIKLGQAAEETKRHVKELKQEQEHYNKCHYMVL